MASFLSAFAQKSEKEGNPMKSINSLFVLVLLTALAALSGCYTQLATTEEGEDSYASQYDEPKAYDDDDSYDSLDQDRDRDEERQRYMRGFRYYYPSWSIGFG